MVLRDTFSAANQLHTKIETAQAFEFTLDGQSRETASRFEPCEPASSPEQALDTFKMGA